MFLKLDDILYLCVQTCACVCLQKLQSREVRCGELLAMCQQKDEMVSKLQATMDKQTEATAKDVSLILFWNPLHYLYHYTHSMCVRE